MGSVALVTQSGLIYNFNTATGETRLITIADRTLFDIDFDSTGQFYGLGEDDTVFTLDARTGATAQFLQFDNGLGLDALEFSDRPSSGLQGYVAGDFLRGITLFDEFGSRRVIDNFSDTSAGDLEIVGNSIYWTTSDDFRPEDGELVRFSLTTGDETGRWAIDRSDAFGLAETDAGLLVFAGQQFYTADGTNDPVYRGVVGVSETIAGAASLPEYSLTFGDDQFVGTSFDDEVAGLGGDDTIYGAIGDDVIFGDRGGRSGAPQTLTAGDRVTVAETGQSLALSVTVPAGSTDGSIDVSGFISRNIIGSNDFNIVYVLDVSGSMSGSFRGVETVGDENGDGADNTLLDGTIRSFDALNASILGAGLAGAEVTVIAFESDARTIYRGTADGNIETSLRSLQSGGGTDYEDALRLAYGELVRMGAGENRVFFLSDGQPNGRGYEDEVAALIDPAGLDTTIRAIGLGEGASLSDLDLVDDGIDNDSAERVLTPSQLTARLTGSPVPSTEIARLEISVNGVVTQVQQATDFVLTPLGLQYNASIDGLDLAADDVLGVSLIASDTAMTRASVDITVPNVDAEAGNDLILGGEGNDRIDGEGGGDVLAGEAGSDVITGGFGSDIIDGGAGFDLGVLRGLAGGGFDLFRIGGSAYALDRADRSHDAFSQTELFVADGQFVGLDQVREFDPLDYVAANDDLARALGLNADAALRHYLDFGFFEGRASEFDAAQYLANWGDLGQALGGSEEAARNHYIASGADEGRLAENPLRYIASFDDLIGAFQGQDAASLFGLGLLHYQNGGDAEGRRAGIDFDPVQYLANHADLAAVFGGDLDAATVHFINAGASENRLAGDPLAYVATHADLVAAFGPGDEAFIRSQALSHWQDVGAAEGRSAEGFDVSAYLANYADLRAVFGDGAGGYDTDAATLHYIQSGFAEGRTDELLPV